jgi:hypothetical protein
MFQFWRVFHLFSLTASSSVVLLLLDIATKHELISGSRFIWFVFWAFYYGLKVQGTLNYCSASPDEYRDVTGKEILFDVFIMVLFTLIINGILYSTIFYQCPILLFLGGTTE